MKRLALVVAIVAMGACQRAEQRPAQAQTTQDTSHMMMADTSKMMMADTSKMMMMSDTSKHMMADTSKKMAPAKKRS
jgi:hypothetical protein